MLKKIAPSALVALALMTVPAFAHPGFDGHAHSFASGFMHPLSGLDHVLAMVAVGLYAASLGGAALWLVPLAFVGTMIGGGLMSFAGWPLPLVEQGIAISVIVMGLAIALRVRLPVIAAAALAGVFALFHGHAHGTEGAGLGVAFLPYAAGFVLATGLLHATGIALGRGLDRLGQTSSKALHRAAGSVGVVAGASLLAGWMTA